MWYPSANVGIVNPRELCLYPLPLPALTSFKMAFLCSFNLDIRMAADGRVKHRIMRTVEEANLRNSVNHLVLAGSLKERKEN